MSHHVPRRALAGAAPIVAAIILAACGEVTDGVATDEQPSSTTSATSDSEPTTTTTTAPTGPEATTIAVSLSGGDVAGEVRTEVVPLDQPVRLEVSGDTEEEVHVHTYDLYGNVMPGRPAVIEFVADIPGVHEVELEGSHTRILELQVEP